MVLLKRIQRRRTSMY